MDATTASRTQASSNQIGRLLPWASSYTHSSFSRNRSQSPSSDAPVARTMMLRSAHTGSCHAIVCSQGRTVTTCTCRWRASSSRTPGDSTGFGPLRTPTLSLTNQSMFKNSDTLRLPLVLSSDGRGHSCPRPVFPGISAGWPGLPGARMPPKTRPGQEFPRRSALGSPNPETDPSDPGRRSPSR